MWAGSQEAHRHYPPSDEAFSQQIVTRAGPRAPWEGMVLNPHPAPKPKTGRLRSKKENNL